jgi:hypothetical protein
MLVVAATVRRLLAYKPLLVSSIIRALFAESSSGESISVALLIA